MVFSILYLISLFVLVYPFDSLVDLHVELMKPQTIIEVIK
jgi:hypothetical protein